MARIASKGFLTSSLTAIWLLTAAVYAASAQAKAVNVFACEPEWGSLAETIGGDAVKVFTATSARQDPHYIQARPSLLAKVRKADLVFCTGAELEVGWLPLLLRKAKASVQPGQIGYLMAADQISDKLEVPVALDRSMGDVHSAGNPHVHLNPYHVLTIAEALTQRLTSISPAQQSRFTASLSEFQAQWQTAITAWEQQAQALQGRSVMVYHKNFSYLLDWLEITLLADLEPLPGIPPTSKHLSELLLKHKQSPANALLYAPYQSEDPVEWFVAKTGITAIKMPYTVGGSEQASDLFSLYQQHIDLLLAASKE